MNAWWFPLAVWSCLFLIVHLWRGYWPSYQAHLACFMFAVGTVLLGVNEVFHAPRSVVWLTGPLWAISGYFWTRQAILTWKRAGWSWPHRDIQVDGDLYLRRYYLTPRTWRWKLFLHHILRPDAARDPHDHPWNFWTLGLRGGYVEIVYDDLTGRQPSRYLDGQDPRAWRAEFQRGRKLKFRKAEHRHRIHTVDPNTWTLVLATRARRHWGFWPMPKTFVRWDVYLNEQEPLPEDRFVERVQREHKGER